MAEKKKDSNKKNTAKNNENKKSASKASVKTKKTTSKKTDAKKAEVKKEVKVVDTYEEKLKKEKKQSKFIKWFNNLTLEQIVVGGFIIIAILLIVLIGVATKNTKTKNGEDIALSVKGKTITANDLYKELKKKYGQAVAIDLIDEYITNKEYKTTDDMKKAAEQTIANYKNNYGDNFKSFLEYNGISSESELKDLLIKNSKLTKITEKYIKDTLTEKEMKKYYEESIKGDISAKHILISTETEDGASDEEVSKKEEEAKAKAEEIIKKLKDGADFSELAKEYSDDKESKKNGGDLGYFNTGDMVEEFEEAAFKLDINEYTKEPVKTTYGYHIIMKTGQKDKPSYKKAKATIIEKLVEQKKENDTTISVKAMKALREEYNLKITDKTIKKDYNTYIKNATTTTTTTTAASK